MTDSASRFAQLVGILNDRGDSVERSGTDSADLHLRSVRANRMRALTRVIAERLDVEIDDLDGMAMRLLLDDHASAVAHLRGVAHEGEKRLASARARLKDVRRYLAQRSQSASTEPSVR